MWNKLAAMWLSSTVLTGLRPSEWEHAELTTLNDSHVLRVRKGKATNGRSHGEFRTVPLIPYGNWNYASIEVAPLTPEIVTEAKNRIGSGVPKAKVAREMSVSRQTLYV
jgi:hypothetical protein